MKKQNIALFSVIASGIFGALGLSGLSYADNPPPAAQPQAQAQPPSQPQAADKAKAPTPSSASGKITAYTAGAHGELDGFILDNGTTVHFPPNTGFKVRPLLQKGQALAVDGNLQPGPVGQVLEAKTIKNTVTGKSIDVANILPPGAVPPGAVSPPGMPALNQAPNNS